MPEKLEINRHIGAVLRGMRRRRALADAEVARRMGYGRNGKAHVNRWERGERGMSAALLLKYLGAIGATLSELDRELRPRPAGEGRLAEITRELESLADRAIR